MRLHVESTDHEESCFITLTYDEENLPYDDSLQPVDLQRFIKRLRKRISPRRIRFYSVGEYGGKFQRPHYHLIVYGYNFPDRKCYIDRGTHTIDNSGILTSLWEYGFSTVQNYDASAAAYCAKYAVKKITGEPAKSWYQRLDPDTGEVYQLAPEFARMSNRPGIGANWLKKYHGDIYPKGYVTDGKGNKVPPPEYFNKLFRKWYPDAFEEIRKEKRKEVFDRYMNPEPERAKAREKIQTAQYNLRRTVGDKKS